MTSIEIDMLGELEVRVAGTPVLIPGGKQRLLLAALALRAPRSLTTDELIDRLWCDQPPETARTTLRGYVKRLRTGFARAGADGMIEAVSGGYRLRADHSDIDLERFRALRRQAAAAAAPATAWRTETDPNEAHRAVAGTRGRVCELRGLEEALRRWRGPALSGLERLPWVASSADAAEEEYLQACERRAELRLELGQADRAVSELRPLVTVHPHRETLWTRLLLALHHSGRTAEALLTYDEVRRRLADGLGVGPCASLRAVHVRLLREDGPQQALSAGCDEAEALSWDESLPWDESVQDRLPADVADGGTTPPNTIDAATAAPPNTIGPPTAVSCVADSANSLPGREGELAALDGALDGKQAALVVVDGPAGAGKTALVSHWARSAGLHASDPRFPGGLLRVDLRGFHPEPPLTTRQALTDLLIQAGYEPGQLPADPVALGAMLRRASSRNRAVVVLDNARDAAQVRPLLPGGTSAAIVTSRNQLRGLAVKEGAVRVRVGPLGARDGARVIAAFTAVDEQDSAEVYELVELCDGLPLALRIAAEELAQAKSVGPAWLAGRLGAEAARLDLLDAGDTETSLRSVLARGHAHLTPSQAELLRALATEGKLDFDVDDVAGLARYDRNEARTLVRGLVLVNLVVQRGPDTFRLGDLQRLAAAEMRSADVR